MWNQITRTPNQIQLAIVSRSLLLFLQWAGILAVLGGFGLIAMDITRLLPHSFSYGLACAAISLLLGLLILRVVLPLLRQVAIRFVFDLKERKLFIEELPDKQAYQHIPQQIPFTQIRLLRLVTVRRKKQDLYHLELILQDDIFYPLSTFKDPNKARHVSRELQQVLGVGLDEKTVEKRLFRDYKNSFLKQFEAKPPA